MGNTKARACTLGLFSSPLGHPIPLGHNGFPPSGDTEIDTAFSKKNPHHINDLRNIYFWTSDKLFIGLT
jgi:hypothetical protein